MHNFWRHGIYMVYSERDRKRERKRPIERATERERVM